MLPNNDNKARKTPLIAAPNFGDKMQQKNSLKFKNFPHACKKS